MPGGVSPLNLLPPPRSCPWRQAWLRGAAVSCVRSCRRPQVACLLGLPPPILVADLCSPHAAAEFLLMTVMSLPGSCP